jgi:hypothetical protein
MVGALVISSGWMRARRRLLGLTALVAAVAAGLAYMAVDVPVASAPLPNGHQLFFCPLWAPPVPRAVAMLHWHGALLAAIIVVAVDSLALLGYRRRGVGWRGGRRGAGLLARRAAMLPPTVRLQRVPARVALLTAAASATLLLAAAMQGYALWLIALFGLAPWLPLVMLEAVWKYEHYGVWALFGVIVLLQIGHMGEHTVQVTQLMLTHGQLAQSHGLFGQLDFETVHFIWDSTIWVSLCLLLRPFAAGNRWLWVAFVAASLHEVEHLYLFWIYWAHPAFYAAGGFEGIMGYDGVIGSPLARPYLHFAYNFLVIVPMALAFWDETKRVRSAWPQPAPPESPLAVGAAAPA